MMTLLTIALWIVVGIMGITAFVLVAGMVLRWLRGLE
jgi:hypothetical protein